MGREVELALLERELERASSEAGRILIVRGEAGVGKTWVVEEALARREASGRALVVRRARCSDVVGAPAFWPWRQLLPTAFPFLASADTAGIAASHSGDPFEWLHETARGILASFGPPGSVLVIDDLHWADAASIALLDVLAQSIEGHPVALLATAREALPTNDVNRDLEALSRHRAVHAVPLRGWRPDEIGAYLEALGSRGLSPEEADVWHRVSGGNPYFVDELRRAGFRPGAESRPPEVVQRLIEERVTTCDPPTRTLLAIAAVIGRDFPLALADRLAKNAFGEPIEGMTVDRAIGARLIELAEDPGSYRLVHALVGAAIRQTLPSQSLAAIRGELGALLAAEPALRVAGIAEVAHHLTSASDTLPRFAEAAVHFSRWAGLEASLQSSNQLAVQHYRDALRAQACLADATERAALERAELLVALGHSLALASPQDADAALDEAGALAEKHLDGAHARRAARVLGLTVVVRAQERCPATRADCDREAARAEQSLETLGGVDGLLRAQLLAALPLLLAFEPDRERSAVAAREAMEVAREVGDPLVQGRALEALHWALLGDPSADERLAVASRVLAEAQLGGSERLAATARYWRYFDLLELGHVAEAQAELAEIDDIAQRLAEPRRRHQALTLRAGLAVHLGRLELAETLAEEALALGRHAAIPESVVCHEAVMTRVAFERDDPASITNRESLRSPLNAQALFRVSNPMILRWQGREQSAATDMDLLKTRGFETIPHGPDRLVTLYTLGWASFYLQDREATSALYDLLEPHAGRIVVFHLGAFTGSISRLLANLAALLGRTEVAQRHFRAAFQEVKRADARCEWGHLHLERARLRMARGERPDAESVVDDLRRALALARETGSLRIENQIRASHPELVVVDDAVGGARRTGWLQRRGKAWSIGLGAPLHEVPDARGLHFMAALLARPGEEILATTLVADVTGDLEVPLERARLRVTQRVRSTVARLRELDPLLAAHLANSLRTGNYCAYLPRADDRITWRL